MQSLEFYVDASYSPTTKIGISALITVVDNVESEPLITEYHNVKNSQLEKEGIEECIKIANSYLEKNPDLKSIKVYSDCKSAVEKYNSELIEVVWIKGHKPTSKCIEREEIIFKKVDKIARKILRQKVNDQALVVNTSQI